MNRGSWAVFDVRYVLTPITIAWCEYHVNGGSLAWKSLYIFGLRIARWRADQ